MGEIRGKEGKKMSERRDNIRGERKEKKRESDGENYRNISLHQDRTPWPLTNNTCVVPGDVLSVGDSSFASPLCNIPP